MKTKKFLASALAAVTLLGTCQAAFAADLKGDVNGDGKLNAKDATALLKLVASGKKDAKYDFNGDGKVNAKDATSILKSIVGGGSGSSTSVKESPASDFNYYINMEGCHITSYKGKGGKVVIPKKIEDTPVVRISPFSYNDTIKSIVIPEGVKVLTPPQYGGGHFSNCKALESAILPSSLVEDFCNKPDAYDNLFAGCTKLKSVSLPEGFYKIPYKAFAGCASLTSITIPSTVNDIRPGAFYGAGLKSVNLPAGLEEIGKEAFKNCKNLTSITIPDKVWTLGEGSFEGSGLKSIVIGKGVRYIDSRALYCPSLKTVKFAEGMEVLKADAIYSPNLEKVELPSTLRGFSAYTIIAPPDNIKLIYKGQTYGKTKIPLLSDIVSQG